MSLIVTAEILARGYDFIEMDEFRPCIDGTARPIRIPKTHHGEFVILQDFGDGTFLVENSRDTEAKKRK